VTLLLDTHTLLWFAGGDRRLSRVARAALEASDAVLMVSAASVWEMAIMASLGRLTLPGTVASYIAGKLDEGYELLPIAWTHAALVETLPDHHRDPFDRILAAQAISERVSLVTRDGVFKKYGVATIW
jgi:PIN domain nuclease of toxin-antitoxin system